MTEVDTVVGTDDIIKSLRRTLSAVDSFGWKLAELTHQGVNALREADAKLTQGKAIEQLVAKVDRPRFSVRSARLYFTLWEKFGDPEKRLYTDDLEESFFEHYTKVRGSESPSAASPRRRGAGQSATEKDNGGRGRNAEAPAAREPTPEETIAREAADEAVMDAALQAEAIRDDGRVKDKAAKFAKTVSVSKDVMPTGATPALYDTLLKVKERVDEGEGNRPADVLAELSGALTERTMVRDTATAKGFEEGQRNIIKRTLAYIDAAPSGLTEDEAKIFARMAEAAADFAKGLRRRVPIEPEEEPAAESQPAVEASTAA